MKKDFQNLKIVWKNPAARRLILSNLTSLAGDAASMLVIPLLILDVTGSASKVVFALLFATVGTIVGGQVILPRLKAYHPVLIARTANLAQAIIPIIIIGISFLPYFEWTVLPLTFTQAIFVAINHTSSNYIIKEAVDQEGEELSLHFNSVFEFSTYFGRTVGPLVVGLILWLTNLRTALVFDAATFVIAAIILKKIKFDYIEPTEKPSIRKSLSSYPRALMTIHLLLPASIQFAFTLFGATATIHLVQKFLLHPGQIAIYDAFEAGGLLLGSFLAPFIMKKGFMFPVAFGAIVIGYFGFYFSKDVFTFAAADVLCCIGLAASSIFLRSGVQKLVRKEEIATVMALRLSLINFAKTVSMIFSSVFLITSTTTELYLIAAVLLGAFFFGAIALTILESRHRRAEKASA